MEKKIYEPLKPRGGGYLDLNGLTTKTNVCVLIYPYWRKWSVVIQKLKNKYLFQIYSTQYQFLFCYSILVFNKISQPGKLSVQTDQSGMYFLFLT